MSPEQIFRLGYDQGRRDGRADLYEFAVLVDAELRGLQSDLRALGTDVRRYQQIECAAAAERDENTVLH